MAEEKDISTVDTGSSDDVSVLRVLLHNIRGLSPVSTTDYLNVPVSIENDVES